MSKHKEKTPAPLADWQVTDTTGGYGSPVTELVRQARWKRDDADWVIFRDEQGIVATYAPGAVLSIIRKDPPVVVHPPAGALDGRLEIGGLVTGRGQASAGIEGTLPGPAILPVTPHGGK